MVMLVRETSRTVAIATALLCLLSGFNCLNGVAGAGKVDDSKGPVFLKEPTNRIDFSNSTGAVVECSATGNPPPEMIWIRSDGTAVGDVPGLRQILPNGNLVFPPFRAEDYRQEVHAQVYACMAKNQFGSVISRDVNVRAVINQHYGADILMEYVIRGNSAILKCSIPSFVSDFVRVEAWIDEENNELVHSENYDGKYMVLPSGELHIREVGPEDGYKSYQCRTKHRLTGETRLSATKGRLVITEPIGSVAPRLTSGDAMRVQVERVTANATLLCPAQSFPVPAFRWYKYIEGTQQKKAVVLDDRVKQVSGTLIIKDAVVDDSGKYLCVVNNSVGGESVETVLTVTAPLAAKIEPRTQTVDFGRPAVFTCKFSGNPIKTVSWMKDGKSLGHSDAVLRIESVKKEDKGMYQCFIRNDQESAQASAELKLGGRFDPPIIREAFPEETRHPGPSVFLKCVAGGNPTPEISWELDGKKITNSERYQVGQYVTVNGDVVSHLNITSIHSNDGGLYKCMASSKVGVAEHSAKLNVYGLPYVRTMEKKAIVAGETLIVTCPVAGYPIESIVWERDNRQLPINRKQKVFPNGTLIIENVERNSDQATYTCVAKNSEGYTARGTLEVQVMAPPKIAPFVFGEDALNYGDSASVQCSVISGDMPIMIEWLFNNASISKASFSDSVNIADFGKRTKALAIDGVDERYAGNYTCRATNRASSTYHTAELIVNVPPRWILEPTDKAFAQGSNAKVECKADGFPKPQVTWKKAVGDTPGEYKDLRSNDSSIRVEEGSLFIQNIQKSNEGYYLCEAINGIGSGLSAVTLITVQAPPEFVEKLRNQTARRGEPSVLQCEAKGEKPIGILWNMNNIRLDPKSDNRYTIREEILPNGVTSSLSIKRTERSDSALFTCMATNAFGSDDTSINMIIQEVPEMPYALKVLDKSGRTVQLSWAKPYDGNSPLKRYIIEFKRSRGSWENDIDRVIVPGDTNEAQVQKLSPATTYNIRIVAENEIGVSDPSDVVTIITAEEAPSGKPQAIKVEAINQATLRVSWKAPPRAEWNGDILGYYVGYKQTSLNTLYVYETVNYSPEGGEGKEHSLEINNLKTYTQYSIVIQAFNKVGAGPMSDEEKQYTAEGTPDQPPSDTMCTTLTSQTIRVSWVSPPLESANGVIKGYKVVYAPSDLWNNDKNKDYKKTASSDTVLHGLKKYTNYTMQVLATTSGGDGVRSAPIHCQTEQDVPEAPTAVKALVMSEGSIFVSWQPPAQPNGLILQYTVYIKSGDQEPKSFKVPSYQINYEASGLEKNQKYEFWVTASTTIGEGQSSKTLSAMPSDKVPAKIASFDDKFTATFKEDAKLPCLAVGSPAPEITWKIKGVEFVPNERIRQLPEGSLFIKDVIRQDAGDYTCTAENSIAKDSITHRLIVLAPPQSPQLTLTATTTDSLSVKLKPHESDTAPLQGYTLHYKPEFGEWETIDVALEAPKYTIEKLYCGSRYQVYATAYNSIGAGEPSDILNTRTKGSKPLLPEKSRFIEVSSNSITLHLPAWKDGGCRMSHFVVEHKKKDQIDWNQISNNVKPGGNFVVLDLEPATWYNLRVTAHNNAGFTVAEYEFATLTITGGTVAPIFGSVQPGTIYPPWIPHWIDLNVMVPLIATVIVVAVGVLVICVAISRRRDDDPRCGPKDVYYDVVYNQSMGPAGAATLDKRRPDIRDELGYIAPPNRKLPPVPGSNYNTCDRVKRGTVISHNPSIKSNHTTWDPRRPLYEELKKAPPPLPRRFNHPPACYGMEDEICPYATFHLLGFREEMDPTKAMNFQTFPHQNGMGGPGHMGTMGSSMAMQVPSHVHSRSGSQSMPRQNRYARKNSQGGQSSIYTPAPEYDDPANCAEEDQYRRYTRINSQGGSLYCGPGPEYDDPANCAPEDDQYGSQYGGNYGTPYEHYGSRGSVGRRSVGSPEPPPPPPRNHDTSNSSFNDSKESNEISEAECDRDNGPRGNYGEPSEASSKSNDAINGDETEKLLKRNEVKPKYTKQTAASGSTGLTAYDTMAV
ncbi:Down syndrome cell adhesion molecule-like protein Dscam2 isoform X34 [Anopheles arabiensis]|uniref:Down syndrome cell adhesion molecule-like protein Dscam2 isoform X34 n=1 Tax=Anopheles arabiensis TaxID=7173 RepID=UPI001AAC7F47|nr:Down syndrome cell adhesion molecule-like protein Dscam2 isoform X34 [Anopheles arabiensis]XP_040238702.1 Down syndrome cell adhesion molecule-like protein Dscam2 isoform X29 [Anopheles coluzzii]XP_061517355.1 cell adhesion molecule Dscam2 isoform X27 [Anopheles gambiae]